MWPWLVAGAGRRCTYTVCVAVYFLRLTHLLSLCRGRAGRYFLDDLLLLYEKSRRVWNMKCGGMRASTLGCRFLDSCGDSLGVEFSFLRIFVYSQRFRTVDAGCN